MAQNQKVLWSVLQLLHGHPVVWEVQTKGQKPKESTVDNAFAVGKLKGELVLKYEPADIEDTIYFLKHRGYLEVHGMGLVAPELLYSLTEKAVGVFENRRLPEEEQSAFDEALWDITKPRVYGVGPNLSEITRRAKRFLSRKPSG